MAWHGMESKKITFDLIIVIIGIIQDYMHVMNEGSCSNIYGAVYSVGVSCLQGIVEKLVNHINRRKILLRGHSKKFSPWERGKGHQNDD